MSTKQLGSEEETVLGRLQQDASIQLQQLEAQRAQRASDQAAVTKWAADATGLVLPPKDAIARLLGAL